MLPHLEQTENRMRLLDGKKKRAIAQRMGETMKLHPMDVSMAAGNLSGGNQQKVVLGKWLTGDPQIILMDEPTRGIDIGAKAEIYRFITQLAQRDKTIIIFSSELEECSASATVSSCFARAISPGEMPAAEATAERLLTLALGGANA